MTRAMTADAPELWRFTGGAQGRWAVERIVAIVGETLTPAARLELERAATPRPAPAFAHSAWSLLGFTSNRRYATRAEMDALAARPAPLARPEASCAVLIPIRKSAAWWALAQDERRAIFEEQSRHTAIGLRTMPAVARRLHHSRDLGEPFDFLTWFEFAPEHTAVFDDMLGALRETAEWAFVEREVELRLTRTDEAAPA